MREALLLNRFILIWMGAGLAAFIGLHFISAPYGRFSSRTWGPVMQARLAWLLMEIASPLLMAFLFFTGKWPAESHTIIFLLMWEVHYIQRAFFYPALIRPGAAPMPLSMLFFGILFNTVNAWVNGRWVFHLASIYEKNWFLDPRFIGGMLIFVIGFVINLHSDAILRKLRPKGEVGYRIPHGGLYRWISSPNYLGEILEWGGWALATWSLAGLSFFVWTIGNLLPRALSNHRWYQRNFPDYPADRRAIIPKIL